MSREDAAVCHGMMGGIPAYIEKSDPVAPLKDNIKRLFLTPTGYLFEEPSNLLLQECRNPEQYDATVQAIAQGRSKISEITSSTGIPASNVKDDDEGAALFAECKWRNEPVGEDVLQKPVHRSELFRRQRKSYALFSKRGFTQGCRDAAESRGDVKLISFAEM